jgi:hypothetical protein
MIARLLLSGLIVAVVLSVSFGAVPPAEKPGLQIALWGIWFLAGFTIDAIWQ